MTSSSSILFNHSCCRELKLFWNIQRENGLHCVIFTRIHLAIFMHFFPIWFTSSFVRSRTTRVVSNKQEESILHRQHNLSRRAPSAFIINQILNPNPLSFIKFINYSFTAASAQHEMAGGRKSEKAFIVLFRSFLLKFVSSCILFFLPPLLHLII